MKNKISVITGIAAGIVALAVFNLEGQVALQASFSTTIIVENTNVSDNDTVTVSPAPRAMRFGTKEILAQLALDENAEGNYGSTTFPSGAKLVYMDTGSYVVLDRNNNLLVDVSDIFHQQFLGDGISVTTGKSNDTTGAGTTTQQGIDIWTYEDGGYGPISMSMTGIGTFTKSLSTPDRNGNQTISESFSLKNASGQGHITLNEINAVMTGTESASGRATQSAP